MGQTYLYCGTRYYVQVEAVEKVIELTMQSKSNAKHERDQTEILSNTY